MLRKALLPDRHCRSVFFRSMPNTLRDNTKFRDYLNQCRNLRVLFICYQEHRRKRSGVSEEEGYIIAQTPADDGGHGGCFVAVSSTIAVALPLDNCSLPVKIGASDVNIIHCDHRLGIIRVAAPRLQSLLVSAHGLDKSHGEDAVIAYWKRTGDLLEAAVRPGDSIMCGIDGNCRISRSDGNSDIIVGSSLDPDSQHNFVSDAVIGFARRFQLRITTTFSECAAGGPQGTLARADGTFLRCDYILVSQNCDVSDGPLRVLHEFKLSNKTLTMFRLPLTSHFTLPCVLLLHVAELPTMTEPWCVRLVAST